MQDLFYNAQIRSIIRSNRWPIRFHRAFQCLGCWSHEQQEFPMLLSSYVPVGRLHRAASIGAVCAVDGFLTSGEYHVDQIDRRKRSALHYTCTYGHSQVASLLIEKNCNINALDDEKSTPLIKAAQWGNVLCLSVLLNHGADPHAMDVHVNNALHYTVFRGNIWLTEMLLACNADIEARTKRGFTPFLLSIHEQKEDMAEFLEENGADVHAVVCRESASSVPKPEPPAQKCLVKFSKIPGADVAGPPTKDTSSSNNEVGETPITHLSSSRQRIPGLSENLNLQPPPALDSGDTSYLTADGDLTETIPFISLEMVILLLILVCVLLCFLSPLMLAMWAKDVIF